MIVNCRGQKFEVSKDILERSSRFAMLLEHCPADELFVNDDPLFFNKMLNDLMDTSDYSQYLDYNGISTQQIPLINDELRKKYSHQTHFFSRLNPDDQVFL